MYMCCHAQVTNVRVYICTHTCKGRFVNLDKLSLVHETIIRTPTMCDLSCSTPTGIWEMPETGVTAEDIAAFFYPQRGDSYPVSVVTSVEGWKWNNYVCIYWLPWKPERGRKDPSLHWFAFAMFLCMLVCTEGPLKGYLAWLFKEINVYQWSWNNEPGVLRSTVTWHLTYSGWMHYWKWCFVYICFKNTSMLF